MLDQRFGLACWHGPARAMASPHRHDEIEVNLTGGEPLAYLFGGDRVLVPPGHVTAFWAAAPHQLLAGPVPSVHWVTIPLSEFLGWGLPGAAVTTLLQGGPLMAPSDRVRAEGARFESWARDLADGSLALRRAVVMELRALFERLCARAGSGERPIPEQKADRDVTVTRAAMMARFIADHFREDVDVAAIADSVHLHPHYAMGIFRQVMGTTLGAYLAQRRLAEAQRLLITTDGTVADVATSAGFGSKTRFYTRFVERCGQSPGAYRRAHRAP